MFGVFLLGTMIDHNAGVCDCSIAWDVANVSAWKKKMVIVPLMMPVHPCAKQWSFLLIPLSHRSLSRGSLINLLLRVMASLVTGWTKPLQYSLISTTGLVYWSRVNFQEMEMAEALANPRLMMWYSVWCGILQGVLLLMRQVEHWGRLDGLVVGVLSCSPSGSTIGREWVCCLV